MTAEPIPTLSRRHAAGAPSARGLLFTVLGEFVLTGPNGPVPAQSAQPAQPAQSALSAWTSTFIDVLGRLGVEQKATRQALMRTAGDGWLTSERIGRRTRWLLTPAAQRLLGDGARRIYAFTGVATEWDGRWVLVLARTPESERPTRHLLRTRLSWAGLGNPAPGVWVGTHAGRLAEVEQVLADAHVTDAQVFLGEYQPGGDLPAFVRQAWDLDAIEADYEDFLATFDARTGPDRPDPLTDVVELVHAWRRFPWTDPLLPQELLPAPWSGLEAADLFGRLHERWTLAARADWAALNT